MNSYVRVLLCACLLISALIAWWCFGFPGFGIDDANITFTYAQNIACGRGFTFANNGVPVEGSTSLLWTFACALCFVLGVDEIGVLAFSLLILICSTYVYLKILDSICDEKKAAASICLILLLAAAPGYVVWMSFTCMDIVLWGLFIALLTYDLVSIEGSRRLSIVQSALLYGLIPWVRPESYMVVPLALVLIRVKVWFGRMPVKDLAIRAGAFSISIAALFSWRMSYFGYPFPNTYYAKVSPDLLYNLSEGFEYLFRYLHEPFPALALGATLFFAFAYFVNIARTRKNGLSMYCHWYFIGMWSLGLMLLPVWTGGDHFSSFRFFQPFYPLGCLLLVVCGVRLSGIVGVRRKLVYPVLVAVLPLCGWIAWRSWKETLRPYCGMWNEFFLSEVGFRNGTALNETLSGMDRLPKIGVIVAGGIARTYKGEIVDLMGLNDVRIAHAEGDRIGKKNHAAFNPAKFGESDVELMPFTPNNCVVLDGLSWTTSFGGEFASMVSDGMLMEMRSMPQYGQESPIFVTYVVLKGLCVMDSFVSDWTCVKVTNEKNGQKFVALVRNDCRKRIQQLEGVKVADYMVWDGSRWKNVAN